VGGASDAQRDPAEAGELDVREGTIRLHVSYFAQQDPDVVFDVLRRLQLRCSGFDLPVSLGDGMGFPPRLQTTAS
jgi:hypothetical protein